MNLAKIIVLATTALLFGAQSIDAREYCAAIRGNGEAMPAHWGAMSRLVYERGMPSAIAGGSSASITMFLLESISLNQKFATKEQQALIIKSIQGYLEALAQTPEGQAMMTLMSDKSALKEVINEVAANASMDVGTNSLQFIQQHLGRLQTLLASEELKSLINPEFELYVAQTNELVELAKLSNSPELLQQIEYRQGQINYAIENLGQFNAETDQSLFFRPGVIDFSELAQSFGRMADFYAGYKLQNREFQESVDADLQQFLDQCSQTPQELSWRDLAIQAPHCQELFARAVLTYRNAMIQAGAKSRRVNENIGSHLATFPTTSVLTGDALELYQQKRQDYFLNTDPDFGRDFIIHEQDLSFGYWGPTQALAQIQQSFEEGLLYKADAKSQRFLSLGDAPWLEALSTSPAEPGLSSALNLPGNRISMGGWSDLHPTLILQAHGCQDIVYVTRRGGESLFAQGVMKKLTDYSGFEWAMFEGLSAEQRFELNATGVAADVGAGASEWSKLYNMANPQSSLRRSMRAASWLLCTDWDRSHSREDMNIMIEEAMTAPLISSSESCL
jgi:hypothetical protein